MDSGITTTPALRVVISLFEQLNAQDIRYCHWKSTQRLSKSVMGLTDIDILVDRSQSREFKEILYQCDYKPFISHPNRQFPAIEDYLGFDQDTGCLIHLHIHYRLVLGEQYAKNYYLPLDKPFLQHTYLHLGIKIPVPELEIMVLILRTLLKYRDRDVLTDMLNQGNTGGIPAATLSELRYLLEQTSIEKIVHARDTYAHFIPASLIIKFLSAIQHSPRAGWTLYGLRYAARRALMPYQRYSRMRARSMYYRVLLTRQWPFDRIFRRVLTGRGKHKIPVSGGLTIAFVGADGAGKSTIIKHIVKWLAWRMNVRAYYMGSSQPSLATRALKAGSYQAQRVHAGCRRIFGETNVVAQAAATPSRFLKNLRYVADGRDRYGRFLMGRRQAAQGSIIIYDRYPLKTVRIANHTADGPRIAASCNGSLGPIARTLAHAEENMYEKIQPAEHVFVLDVSPDVSQARKPEHKRVSIEAKAQAIKQVTPDGFEITNIDADQPLDQVLLQIKSALWRLL